MISHASFLSMEQFSDTFQAENRLALARYARRWVKDPLHQWSRQWEYPFAFENLDRYAGSLGASPRILDAGSGITFFPWYVARAMPSAVVECCDEAPGVEKIFASLIVSESPAVRFYRASMAKLPSEDGSYDAIYCLSVLEHCSRPGEVVAEFDRVLKPGGILVVTFDISLDGSTEIAISEAVQLLALLEKAFEPVATGRAGSLNEDLARPDALTTLYFRDQRPELLPWKRTTAAALSSLLELRWPAAPFYALSVFCGVYRKAAHDPA